MADTQQWIGIDTAVQELREACGIIHEQKYADICEQVSDYLWAKFKPAPIPERRGVSPISEWLNAMKQIKEKSCPIGWQILR